MIRTIALALAFFASTPAQAAAPTGCFDTTGPLNLYRVRPNAIGPQFTNCINQSLEILSYNASAGSTTTAVNFELLYVSTIGGRPQSGGVNFSSNVNVQNGNFMVLGASVGIRDTTPDYALDVQNGDINITTGVFRVNDSAGSTLTCSPSETIVNTSLKGGIITGGTCGTAGGGTAQSWAIDDFTTQANSVTTDFTLAATPGISSAVFVFMDGLRQQGNTDYIYVPPVTIRFSTPPASGTASLFVQYAINVATGPMAAVINATQTFSGANTFTQNLTLPAGAQPGYVLTAATSGGLATWQASTITSNAAQFSGTGTPGNPLTLLSSSVTLQGNSFNAANQLVKLDGSGRLPAVDGSQLTNLPIDPILVGIRVVQNTSDPNLGPTRVKSFTKDMTPAPWFYNISMPMNNLGPGATSYYTATSVETDTHLVAFIAGTLKNLACYGFTWDNTNNPTSGQSAVFTVRKNGSDTSMTCTVTFTAAEDLLSRGCNDTSNTVSVSAGDLFSLKVNDIGAEGILQTQNGMCYFQYAF